MEIEDVKKKKGELEMTLLGLLDSFEEETGVRVTAISYDRHWVGDGTLPSSTQPLGGGEYRSSIEVSLGL